MTAHDLIEFGYSPARWVQTPAEDASARVPFWEALVLVHLVPGLIKSRYAVRPEAYDGLVLRCPRCQSQGPGKVCRACGVARKNVTERRPWSAAAAYCKGWAELHTKALRRIVPEELITRAQAASKRLLEDSELADLHENSDRNVAVAGVWLDDETGLKIPLRAVVSYVPIEGSLRDDALATVSVAMDAAPGAWAKQMWGRSKHLSAAFKQDLLAVARQGARPQHLWALVEPDPPYLTARRRATPELLSSARSTYAELLMAYARCLKSGVWPGFEADAKGSLDAWSPVYLEPWMTQGEARGDKLFAVDAVPPTEAAD